MKAKNDILYLKSWENTGKSNSCSKISQHRISNVRLLLSVEIHPIPIPKHKIYFLRILNWICLKLYLYFQIECWEYCSYSITIFLTLAKKTRKSKNFKTVKNFKNFKNFQNFQNSKNFKNFKKFRNFKKFKFFEETIKKRKLEWGPKGPTDAAEGCSSLQVLEKADRRAAIFLVLP